MITSNVSIVAWCAMVIQAARTGVMRNTVKTGTVHMGCRNVRRATVVFKTCTEDNSKCFPIERFCNRVIDCPHGSDEADSECTCEKWNMHECGLEGITCFVGKQIPFSLVNNNITDCPLGDDEKLNYKFNEIFKQPLNIQC